MFYENNIKFLDEKLKKILEKVNYCDKVEVFESKKEENLTAKCRINEDTMILLHSMYGPCEEAETFINQFEILGKEILVVGFGLGYHIEKLLDRVAEDTEVSVLITDLEVFKAAIEKIDLSKIFSDKRIRLIFGKDSEEVVSGLKRCLDNFDDDSKLIIHYPSLKSMDEKYIEIRDILERIDTYKKSFENHHDIVSENVVKNMPIVEKDDGISRLKDAYPDKPIFIISAGPSLEKNMYELKNVSENGIIISVGTAVRKLMSAGIRPDFIVAIDGLKNIKMQLEGVENSGIPLIYFPTINYEALEAYKSKRYVAFPDGDDYFAEFDKKFNKGILKSGGSVATAAIDFAKFIGGRRIIFVGQDLALAKTGHTHAAGTLCGEYTNTMKNLREIDGIDGGKVKTVKNLYIYLKWIENYIKDNADIKFINATQGGASISGTEVIELREAINKYCTKN